MKKITLFLCSVLLGINIANCQLVTFEKFITSTDHYGNIELKDVIIDSASKLVNTGFYKYGQDAQSGIPQKDRGVLTSHAPTSVLNYAYDYLAQDSIGNTVHLQFNSIAKHVDGGYIMVGAITKPTGKGTYAIPGNGDIAIVKVNSLGVIISSVHIDLNTSNDVAYAIKPKDDNLTNFIICGTSTTTYKDGFVMEIDNNLVVQWVTTMDLKISGGTETLVELFDITMDQDSNANIWAVGSITNSSSSDSEGLVVKLSNNGTYQTSRRVYSYTDREVFKHVELDGSDLIITGKSAQQIFSTYYDRMIALKYNMSSHSVSTALHLKSPSGYTYQSIGYDINKSPSGEYFVAGKTTPPSGASVGILYRLNGSFQGAAQYQYAGSGNTGLNALSIDGSNNFIALDGLYTNGTYQDGYVLKVDIYGYSGCSDTLSSDSVSIYFSTSTPTDSINTNYTDYELYVVRDTLIDTLICTDTVNLYSKLMQSVNEPYKIENLANIIVYPNPSHGDAVISFQLTERANHLSVTIKDMLGKNIVQLIDKKAFNSGIYNYKIEEKQKLIPGIYFIMFEVDGKTQSQKLIVQ